MPVLLYVDDVRDNALLFKKLFKDKYKIYLASSLAKAQQFFSQIHIVIVNQAIVSFDILSLFEILSKHYPQIIRILLLENNEKTFSIDLFNIIKPFYCLRPPWDVILFDKAISEAIEQYNLYSFKTNQIKQLVNNIQEQKECFSRLEQENEYLQHMLENIPASMLLINKKGKIIFSNHQLKLLLGYKQQDLLDKTIEALIPKRYQQTHMQSRLKYMDKVYVNPMYQKDLFALHKDGYEIPVEVHLKYFEFKNDFFVITVIADITKQKQIENNLRSSKRFLNAVLNALDYYMAIINAKADIILVNDFWKRFIDENNIDWKHYGIGENYFLLCDQEINLKIFQEIKEVIQGRLKEFYQEYLINKKWFYIHAIAFQDIDDSKVIIIYQDITDRKNMEEEVKQKACCSSINRLSYAVT